MLAGDYWRYLFHSFHCSSSVVLHTARCSLSQCFSFLVVMAVELILSCLSPPVSDVATRLSWLCCERLVEVNAVGVIYRLILSCNRSLPHMELIKFSVSILLNLAKVGAHILCAHCVCVCSCAQLCFYTCLNKLLTSTHECTHSESVHTHKELAHTCMRTRTCKHTHVCMHARTHACVHTCIHKY